MLDILFQCFSSIDIWTQYREKNFCTMALPGKSHNVLCILLEVYMNGFVLKRNYFTVLKNNFVTFRENVARCELNILRFPLKIFLNRLESLDQLKYWMRSHAAQVHSVKWSGEINLLLNIRLKYYQSLRPSLRDLKLIGRKFHESFDVWKLCREEPD